METPNVAVTISRKLGSGGSHVGFLVARKLGFRYLDRAILRHAAKELGLETRSLIRLEEKKPGLFEKACQLCSFGVPDALFLPPMEVPVYSKELFEVESELMFTALQACNAVIVGRGGFVALKGRPRSLHVFVQAGLEFRVQRLLESRKTDSRAEALAKIQDSDRSRASFIREISGLDWQDPANYDLCLDSSQLGLDRAADLIVEAVKKL